MENALSRGACRVMLTLAGSALFAVSFAARAAGTPIGFDAAVTRALAANPRALASRARVEAAQAGERAALGQALPALGVEASVARSNNPLNVFGYRLAQEQASFADFGLGEYSGPGSVGAVPAALNAPGYANNYDTGVVLRVPLYAGGRNTARLREARALAQAARAGDSAARTQLAFDVLQAYAGVQTAAALASAAQQSLSAADSDLKTAELRFHQGLAIESDVLLARAQRESARAVLAAAEAGEDDQLESFRMLLGAPDSTLVPGAAVDVTLPVGSLADLQVRALAANPELQAMAARVTASSDARGATEAGNWPRVDLTLRHDWNADGLALRAPSNTLMATLSWNLFSSGAQSAAVQRASAQAEEARENYRSVLDDTRLAVARVWRAALSAGISAKASAAAATQADEATRLLALRYAQGLATLTQLQASEAVRDRERAQSIESDYRALLARAKLRMLLDELDPATLASPPAAAASF